MIYAVQAYFALFIYMAAVRDGVAERLRSRTDGSAAVVEILNKLWHGTGGWLYIIACLPVVYFAAIGLVEYWLPPISAILIRIALFNPVRNRYALEPIWYIGGTATSDKIARKWFGANGSRWLTIISVLILIILNIIYVKIHPVK